MQPRLSPIIAEVAGRRRLLIMTAASAYVLAALGGVLAAFGATLLSAMALAALGLGLALHLAARIPAQPARALGGRAQAALRGYRRLALLTLGMAYLTLVLGALVAQRGALWACLALPICADLGTTGSAQQLAIVALSHRFLAAATALLTLLLAERTRRLRREPIVRRLVLWGLALMAAQILIGMAQVALAAGAAAQLPAVRGLHLAVGVAAWCVLVAQATLALRLPFPAEPASQPAAAGQPQVMGGARWLAVLKDYVSLTKPGVITLLILTTIVGMYITPAGAPPLVLVLWTFVGGWLMASGAHAVNCWADRDLDINMGRTSRRPIPSGRIPAWHALALGIALGAIAFAILAAYVNLAAALLALAGYLYYVLIYTRWLKRSTPSNIVIGGGAGAFPPLVGWAAATGGLSFGSLLLFAIIFYWTPPHFWALALIRAKDYARAGVPMLPVVAGEAETRRQIVLYSIQMLVLTALPTLVGMFGLPYLLAALILGAIFLRDALLLKRDGTVAAAWRLYKYSLLYLALLFGAMVLDRLLFAA